MEIHLAPIQGYTDNSYRKALFITLGGVDFYYTPYYSTDNLSKAYLGKKISHSPEDLFKITIPQILPANLSELKILLPFVMEMNTLEININLGCPYPMAINKGRGAFLIHNHKLVNDMVNFISDNSDLKISLKTRIGNKDKTEIFNLLENINISKLNSIIIHPRIATQLYKGNVFIDVFVKCKELFPKYNLVYNGDITSIDDIKMINSLIPDQDKWMIGRGLLYNPLLAMQLKSTETLSPSQIHNHICNFANTLILEIENDSNDSNHALNRIKNQIEYLSAALPNSKKINKSISKSKSADEIKYIINHS